MQELITQRIKYLIEHGGVLEDPRADIKRTARVAIWVAAGAAALSTIEFAIAILFLR
jgi:hypothetical protein